MYKPATLTLTVEGPCKESGTALLFQVNFLPCPNGFELSNRAACDCEKRIQKYTNSCDINTQRLSRNSNNFWVGLDASSQGLILHPHCPFDYCTFHPVSFTLNSTDLQCTHMRSGILCGECKSGLSVNLGSNKCSSCSNWYILLLLPIATAGFFLVIFLFTCKVTVAAGTTSGLLFYANVIAVNRAIFYNSGDTNLLRVFIAWLNLDIGFESCLCEGLDMYTRTWLQFVFPIYIWALVGLITLASRYSITVSRLIGPTNPTSVLATLFLLSYSKLLRTIIATFSFTTLDYPNDKSVTVWVYDGNITFLNGKHIALFLAGLLTFLLLFLPYTVLLVLGQWIKARSNHRLLSWANNPKVQFFLDAYHALYKNRHRYWVGLLLVVRSILFVISAVVDINSPKDPSVNLLVLAITCTALIAWIWNTGSMYRNWYNNVLESFFILNLAVLAVASYQVKIEGGNQEAVVYTSMSTAFVIFVAIIVYHVILCVLDSRLWRNSIAPKLQSCRHSNEDSIEMEPQPVSLSQPVMTTFVELREPLLESQH